PASGIRGRARAGGASPSPCIAICWRMPNAGPGSPTRSRQATKVSETTMPINVWDYLREYDELRDEILAAVDRVFRSGRLILGQEGVKFEREMAAYLGVADGVGVNSGTDAIYIALASLGVKAGDEVITVPNTRWRAFWAILASA